MLRVMLLSHTSFSFLLAAFIKQQVYLIRHLSIKSILLHLSIKSILHLSINKSIKRAWSTPITGTLPQQKECQDGKHQGHQ